MPRGGGGVISAWEDSPQPNEKLHFSAKWEAWSELSGHSGLIEEVDHQSFKGILCVVEACCDLILKKNVLKKYFRIVVNGVTLPVSSVCARNLWVTIRAQALKTLSHSAGTMVRPPFLQHSLIATLPDSPLYCLAGNHLTASSVTLSISWKCWSLQAQSSAPCWGIL